MAQRTCRSLHMRGTETVVFNTDWHGFEKKPYDSPFTGEDKWDPSWKVPLEFEMEDGKIVQTALVYQPEYDCFDYDEENYDFCAYFDVYSIAKWRYSSETPIVNT